MEGYEIVGYWKHPKYCFLCGEKLDYPKEGYGFYPYCDHYNPGGFCTIPFGDCIFGKELLCEKCKDAREQGIYVGDLCYEIGGPMEIYEREKYGYEDEEFYYEYPEM